MYIKTPRAAVWLDADGTAAAPQRPQRPAAQTIEARKAFDGQLGRYIAIRRISPASPGGPAVLLVAVANKSSLEKGPSWVRAETALTPREAARWAREGF